MSDVLSTEEETTCVTTNFDNDFPCSYQGIIVSKFIGIKCPQTIFRNKITAQKDMEAQFYICIGFWVNGNSRIGCFKPTLVIWFFEK